MADASRCPQCKEKIHPFAGTCPSCLADLDSLRRRAATNPPPRRPISISLPRSDADMGETLVASGVMLILALLAPVWGAILSILIAVYSRRNGLSWRFYIAIVMAVLGLINFIWPSLLNTAIIF